MESKLSDRADEFFQELFEDPRGIFPPSEWELMHVNTNIDGSPVTVFRLPYAENRDTAFKMAALTPTGLVIGIRKGPTPFTFRDMGMRSLHAPYPSGLTLKFENPLPLPLPGMIQTNAYYGEKGELLTVTLDGKIDESEDYEELAEVPRHQINQLGVPSLLHITPARRDIGLVPGGYITMEMGLPMLPQAKMPDPGFTNVRVIGMEGGVPELFLDEQIPIIATIETLREMVQRKALEGLEIR